jgi:excisionase family DNA binding protein
MIPTPEEQPTMTVEQAGEFLDLGRSSAYEAARRGELPVLRFGRTLRVATAELRRLLGIDLPIEGDSPRRDRAVHAPDVGRVNDAPSVEVPLSAQRLLVELFEPETLRHLASLLESERPANKARRRLSAEDVEEFARMIGEGRTPTIGWWRRHTGGER